MPQSSAMSPTVILVSGFFSSRFFSDCSKARFVTCDIGLSTSGRLLIIWKILSMPNCTIIASKIVNENKTFENIFCGMEGKKALHRDRKTSIIEKTSGNYFRNTLQ